jgi:hypothetical protein
MYKHIKDDGGRMYKRILDIVERIACVMNMCFSRPSRVTNSCYQYLVEEVTTNIG